MVATNIPYSQLFKWIFRPLLWSACSFPGGAVVKNPFADSGDTRDAGSISGLGRSPGEGNDNPLQYCCLENSIDRGACGLESMRLQRVRHNSTQELWAIWSSCTALPNPLRVNPELALLIFLGDSLSGVWEILWKFLLL